MTLHLMWGFACLQPVLLSSSWYLLQSFIHLLNPPSLVSFLTDLTCPHSRLLCVYRAVQVFQAQLAPVLFHGVLVFPMEPSVGFYVLFIAMYFFPALNSCQIHVKCSGRCCLLKETCLSSFGDDTHANYSYSLTVAWKFWCFRWEMPLCSLW